MEWEDKERLFDGLLEKASPEAAGAYMFEIATRDFPTGQPQEILMNLGNTIIADAVKYFGQNEIDLKAWHKGFMDKYMPWLAGQLASGN